MEGGNGSKEGGKILFFGGGDTLGVSCWRRQAAG